VSKERALRRAEREREHAIRAAARARAEERRQRRTGRRQALFGWLPRPRLQPGLLAARRRRQLATTGALLLALNVLVWVVSREAEVRVVLAMVSLLAAPVLHTLLFRRR
jgi:Flp pilus assembly protein TadB